MRLTVALAENIFDRNASREQRIADQRTVAAPGHGLGAHDRGRLFGRTFQKSRQPRLKLLGLHVIRVAAKRQVRPGSIPRIFRGVPQASEVFEVEIRDLGPL